mgnify:CR=1 FL=1
MKPIFTLIIEDDERIGAMLGELVSSTAGFSLMGRAGTLAEADRLMAGSEPRLLMVDISLPDGSGLDLCRQLRGQTDFRKLPLIALSADALPDHIARALQTGFNHYLVKPLQIPRLLGILATLPSTQAAPPTR